MKTLYESILDDEDVLISKSINRSKNPFIILKGVYDNINFDNDKKSYEKWRNAVSKELQKINLPNWVAYSFSGDNIEFTTKINGNDISLFSLKYNPTSIKNDDIICYMFCYYKLIKNPKTRYRKLTQEQFNWIKDFENTYGFKTDISKINGYWKILK